MLAVLRLFRRSLRDWGLAAVALLSSMMSMYGGVCARE